MGARLQLLLPMAKLSFELFDFLGKKHSWKLFPPSALMGEAAAGRY
jgi:hypothetical protein